MSNSSFDRVINELRSSRRKSVSFSTSPANFGTPQNHLGPGPQSVSNSVSAGSSNKIDMFKRNSVHILPPPPPPLNLPPPYQVRKLPQPVELPPYPKLPGRLSGSMIVKSSRKEPERSLKKDGSMIERPSSKEMPRSNSFPQCIDYCISKQLVDPIQMEIEIWQLELSILQKFSRKCNKIYRYELRTNNGCIMSYEIGECDQKYANPNSILQDCLAQRGIKLYIYEL